MIFKIVVANALHFSRDTFFRDTDPASCAFSFLHIYSFNPSFWEASDEIAGMGGVLGDTGSSFNIAKLDTYWRGTGLDLAAVRGVELLTEFLGLCMSRKSCFGVSSEFSQR